MTGQPEGSPLDPSRALAGWGSPGSPEDEPDAGLINRTWLVRAPGGAPTAVLQWVNPIFSPLIHRDIAAITAHLAAKGLVTPRLLPLSDGQLWLDDPAGGCWRLMTYIPGRTLHSLQGHRVTDERLAAAAGALVGRFHAAVADCDYAFQAPSRDIHNTPARMAELAAAARDLPAHPLAADVAPVADGILAGWDRWLAEWDGALALPARVAHGDLKISNLRFDEAGEEGRCLLDLDTLGRLPLAVEMGDAWRSWCNPAGEDDPAACRFDTGIFAASARAWLAHAPALSREERESLLPGIERICLELAARFAADALRNSYFREDRARWPLSGGHNLHRARCQLNLARSAREERARCYRLLQDASPGETTGQR